MKSATTELLNAEWIWLPSSHHPKPHQYVCFRKKFELKAIPSEAVFDISADSDFILTVNGVELGRGQFSDYPREKTFTRFDASPYLRAGENLIAVLAYHRGENFSDHRAGKPGLIASLKLDDYALCSGSDWRCVRHPAFKSGPMPKVTGQQGFTTEFDARNDIDWSSEKLNDDDWPFAEALSRATEGFWRRLTPRPVPVLNFLPPVPAEIVVQGTFIRESREWNSTAETIQNDALTAKHRNMIFDLEASKTRIFSHRVDGEPIVAVVKPFDGNDGVYLIVDLGREEVGLIHFDMEAPTGTLVEFAHGEHLVDGRVRARLGSRNFADSYICREGENNYTLPFRRVGARYLEIHISKFTAPVRINYFGLRPLELPNLKSTDFTTSDSLLEKIRGISVHALKCCMHEHYEDTPWREQSLYAFDARDQALFGYYAFGNYDFAAASFDLLGRGIRNDGLLELCAPAKISLTIPMFSLVWITAVWEHWLHSGDPRLFDTFKDQIKTMLDAALNRKDEQSGLYMPPPKAPEYWHFYEWTPGIDKYDDATPDGRLDALHNLFLLEALQAHAEMLESHGDLTESKEALATAEKLSANIAETFWDEKHQHMRSFKVNGEIVGSHQLTQCLALALNVLSPEREEALTPKLMNPAFEKLTLSSMIYLMRALEGKGMDSALEEVVYSNWSKMIENGSTTCWETIDGDAAFDNAGSLCHGWSAFPAYYLHAGALGVKPLSPGFKTFLVSPLATSLLQAEGQVPTPYGPITVKWTKNNCGELKLLIDAPRECALVESERKIPSVQHSA